VFFCLTTLLCVSRGAFAFDKKESSALSHYIMGVVYEDLGDIDNAIQEYRAALKQDSGNSVVHLNLASSLIKKNEIPKAIEELNIVVQLDPEAVEPHAILALLYSSQNKTDLAAREYEQALKGAAKLQPKNVEIYKSLAAIYLQQKKFTEAESTYKLIIGLSPNDSTAYFYLGSIYNELKNDAAAEKELKRAIELKPDYAEALNFLGYLYVEQDRNLDQGARLIRKALEAEPDNGAYVDSLGWYYFKKGKYKEAQKELERASNLVDDPVVYDHLGELYLKLRDPQKAKASWQKSLQLDPAQESVKKKIENLK
jgi:Tfp pilus assembly protein PilF